CTAEAKENTGSAEAVKRGFGTTLGASVVGALVGAGAGALAGVGAAASMSSEDPKETGLIIAGGAGGGAVLGWFVGTGLGVMASARHAQDLVDDAFQRCMQKRGYKIGRERA